ncbi:uncharacterized protein YprB with RNaseH-like and TPR domain [Halarchaeum rubridurum]|uniref:Uncharacterized protein YprB with RNaseH-like and TPR domain n=1 Tax=Halarchaeum rubridurum TaxID=489911 RepID=A0A830FTU9_9EURY|nr:ribonuclease H-like domain-containing protein [Halarchaeum rubridurum]MBP1954866.1 uncharacterized protein YprB with RNaseH-like and TPR domain [Halarchaeum rubridurum]GGM60367.1 hypothetical protein GCM10009017_08160 [Halarchaeum rubridurum]
MEASVTLAVYPAAALGALTDRALRESLASLDPDAVLAERPRDGARLDAVAGDARVLRAARLDTGVVAGDSGPQLACVSTPRGLGTLRGHEERGDLDAASETYVLSDALAVDVDLTALETTLDGRAAYEDALREAALDGSYTHLTTNADPGYRNDWDGLAVAGVWPGASETSATPSARLAAVSLYGDGTVASETYDPGRFGLRGLDGVGPTRAATLREAGYETKAAVAASDPGDLQACEGLGATTERTIRYSAKARREGVAYRTSAERLPGNDPVFIDIETDGLSPTMIWLIGVYDSRTEAYRSFLATDPEAKGRAVAAFAEWYATHACDRPLVAYNGERFDFPHLDEHIERYCPEHADAWRDAWTFDLLWWASTRDNAVLPGTTNALGDVAAALGWEDANTGLSGAVVGQRFRRWLANPSRATELDWERHERYCEDDVRALAYVYEAVRDADPVPGVAHSDGPRESAATTTTQGTLGDFG